MILQKFKNEFVAFIYLSSKSNFLLIFLIKFLPIYKIHQLNIIKKDYKKKLVKDIKAFLKKKKKKEITISS